MNVLRNETSVRALFEHRAAFLLAMMGIVLVILSLRFAQLQVLDHESYAAHAEDNRIRLRAIAPSRGLIRDRHGRVLAENQPAWRLQIIPERTQGLDQTLIRVAELVEVDESELERFDQRRRQHRPFERIPLKFNLSETEVARLAVNQHRLPGVEVEAYSVRHYPHGELLAHVIGYVGRLDEDDLRRLPADNYRASTHTGKTGLERYYEERLHGHSGRERVETNAQGRVIQVLERIEPSAGNDLSLTLDLDLQRAATAAMGEHTGAVVALAVGSGEVLAMVSQPGYDPNGFVLGMRRDAYQALLESPKRPLFNRVLSGGYEPGSTLKPFIAIAGLQHGVITPDTRVFSGGVFRLPGHEQRYRDWRAGGHGWVDLQRALEESVNTYFYQLAVDLGIDRIETALAPFGFGRATGIDLPRESVGVLPSRAWKRATLNQPWYPGETVITGIGQGFMVVTPLQLAQATAILAAGHQTPAPHLIQTSGATMPAPDAPWSGAPRRAVIDGMEAVVHGSRGTARAIRQITDLRVAGKTGTSQVYGQSRNAPARRAEDVPEHLRNHALFIAVAPADAPSVAVVVVVEHGGGGGAVAAPVAADVLEAALGPGP